MMKRNLLFITLLCMSLFSSAQFIIQEPKLLGGSFNKNLIYQQEFYYPADAKDFSGKCQISFLVDTDGFAKDFKIEQSVTEKLDNAYIDLLKQYIWIPGTQNGQDKAMRINIYEKFKYKKYLKIVKRRGYDKPPFPYTPYSKSLAITQAKDMEEPIKAFYKGAPVNVHQFIRDYIKIPDAARKQGIKGIVELQFIVEASGRIGNFSVVKGVGGGCTEEAIRLMQLLNFEPGKKQGKYIRGSYHIKVNFGNTKY
ncbi:MAG: hypothetical protein B7C24_03110 [Bacteroidetes bacterium 4572_77]|nr:MAG: hypothetical protein B7C24_03110 [Bacteroidetes bacterium 4572_77]